MAILADLRKSVRWHLDDPIQWSEVYLPVDPTVRVYQIPRLGPMITNGEDIDIDGVNQTAGVNYTPYFDASQVVFNTIPTGGQIHVLWQFARFTDENINRYLVTAVRELGWHIPYRDKLQLISTLVQTATLSSTYTAGDTSMTVTSTTGYRAAPGLFNIGTVFYKYTGKDATHFTGLTVWAGVDVTVASGGRIVQDDSANHGFFLNSQIRYVWGLRAFDPAVVTSMDPFDSGTGFNDVAYFHFDEADNFLTLEGDYNAGDVFQVLVGRYYTDPTDGPTLEIPAVAEEPVCWLAAALSLDAREADRDLAAIENKIVDTQGNPPGASIKTADEFRKMWNEWIGKFTVPFPSRKRRMFVL